MNKILKIVSWNARGIRYKTDELFQFLDTYEIDICLLCETWLNPNISIRNQHFCCYRYDRHERRGGGVAVLVRKQIRHKLLGRKNTTNIENIGVQIYHNEDIIDIYACYFPGGGKQHKEYFLSDLRKLTTSKNFILGGDFNSRHQYWGCQRSNAWGNLLFDKLQTNQFCVIFPLEPTYIYTL